jgi:hypothetical protein
MPAAVSRRISDGVVMSVSPRMKGLSDQNDPAQANKTSLDGAPEDYGGVSEFRFTGLRFHLFLTAP